MDFEREEGKTLACCATLQSDATIEADIDEEPDAADHPGARLRTAPCSRIENLTPTIKGVWLKLDDGRRLDFQAGQYVNLQSAGRYGQPRILAGQSPPSSRRRGRTQCPHRARRHGHRLAARDAARSATGCAWPAPTAASSCASRRKCRSIFMAGGSGLSSPRSMILDLLEEGCTLPITLVYGSAQPGRAVLPRRVPRAGREASQLHLRAGPVGRAGRQRLERCRGFVHEAAKAHFDNDFRGHKAYLCGPPVMIEACITTLMQGRLFERDIYTEKFLSAADAQQVRSPLFKRV